MHESSSAVQQPVGHEATSQMHDPPEHRWPVPQAGPSPHAQAPLSEQLSALEELHATQALAPFPQVKRDDVLHVVPEQQPPAHVSLLQLVQMPSSQVSPLGQAWHAAPPEPQADLASPDTHSEPLQHPAQDSVVHLHTPLTHCCPC